MKRLDIILEKTVLRCFPFTRISAVLYDLLSPCDINLSLLVDRTLRGCICKIGVLIVAEKIVSVNYAPISTHSVEMGCFHKLYRMDKTSLYRYCRIHPFTSSNSVPEVLVFVP